MYLIKNANLYAPEHLGKRDILICHNKVAAIAEELNPSIPGLEVIDAAGKIATPGLIDQHVHLTGGGGEGGLHTRTPEFNLSAAIKAGVTTVVGVLGTDSFTRSVKSLVAKTKALHNEGLTTFCLTGAYRYPSDTLTGSVADDMIYIEEVIGCKLAISDHRCSHPTHDELYRLLADVRMASLVGGKAGVLHVHIGATGNGIEPLLALVRRGDIPIWHLRPTHMGRHLEQTVEFTKLGGYADITAKPETAEMMRDLVKQAVPELLTISSDSNGSLPLWNDKHENIGVRVGSIRTLYETLQAMVLRCDMPLEQALQFVTVNVAKAIKQHPRKGTVSVGGDADLLLLDDKLEIDSVFAGGRPMMRNYELLVKGTFEE